jgi:hypothetical protein
MSSLIIAMVGKPFKGLLVFREAFINITKAEKAGKIIRYDAKNYLILVLMLCPYVHHDNP